VQVFDGGDDEADLAGADFFDLLGSWHVLGQVCDLVELVGAHEADFLALGQLAIDDADVGDDAAVVVVDAVEDEGAGRGIGLAARGRELVAEFGQQFVDALAGLGGDEDCFFGGEAQDLLDFLRDASRIGAGQVDLVDDGDDLQADIDGGVGVGDGLGLHALGGIDDEDGTFAGLEGLLDFVMEIHVAGRVDEIEHEALAGGVFFALVVVEDGDGRRLDGDAALALQVHVVEDLVLELALGDCARPHQQAVGERGLAVVDVGDDGEVADLHAGEVASSQ
jgi:hypothetical protein